MAFGKYQAMPEGPSIIIAKEKLEVFVGKKILTASRSARIDLKRLVGKKIVLADI